jgi:hypothetical protein
VAEFQLFEGFFTSQADLLSQFRLFYYFLVLYQWEKDFFGRIVGKMPASMGWVVPVAGQKHKK